MLFNSLTFIGLFLPITVSIFYLLGFLNQHKTNKSIIIVWLVLASLFFYGWWNPRYLILILGSIVFNFVIGRHLIGSINKKKWLLAVGVVLNLSLLAYFKYANFFVNNLNYFSGTTFHLDTIILPLAISFFTFQQIAYLVDCYQNKAQQSSFLYYCLFVCFVPQLIAGPIVHHKEMLPQFRAPNVGLFQSRYLMVGLTVFAIGLFKKTALADNIAYYANQTFYAAEKGESIGFIQSWLGSAAYTCQLYFDFSAYSDMAIGIALLFGFRIPLNFHSPYKAGNIIEFWRRWHMTLSRFLRDYLYIPLGGNRHGTLSRYRNLMITMLLGGLWHGAAWTFVFWGGLHGLYLTMNHLWNDYFPRARIRQFPLYGFICKLLTLLAVIIAWVFFRAESFQGASNILSGMLGLQGMGLNNWHGLNTLEVASGIALSILLLGIALLAPNTQQILKRFKPAIADSTLTIDWPRWRFLIFRPNVISLLFISLVFISAMYFMLTANYVEFIYWSF